MSILDDMPFLLEGIFLLTLPGIKISSFVFVGF